MLYGIEINESELNRLAEILAGEIEKVYFPSMIDDLQEEFAAGVEFRKMPDDMRGMMTQVLYTRDQAREVYYKMDKLEPMIREKACQSMAFEILSVLKYAEYLDR